MKSRYFVLFLLFFIGVKVFQAQGLSLEGSVISHSGKPIPGISLMVNGYSQKSVSDSKGRFRFDLPSSLKDGCQIKFRLLTGGWVIQKPFDGKWNLNDPLQKGIYDVRIVLVPNGSPALWTHEVMTAFIDQMREVMVEKNQTIERLQNPSPVTFEEFISEWAVAHGYTVLEIRKELAKWLVTTENTQDARDIGRWEFHKRNINEAGPYYLKKTDRIERKVKELDEKLHAMRLEKFEYWTTKGDSFYFACKLDSAKWAYEEAEEVFGEQVFFDQWFKIKIAIGGIFARKGRLDSALSIYNDIKDRLLGSQPIDPGQSALVYTNIGLAYQSLGEYHKAISSFEKALSIDKEYYGERHPDVARDYNNLGSAYNSLGGYHKAINFFEIALFINKEYYGERHPRVAEAYSNLGSVFNSLGEYQKAISYFEKVLSIGREFYGERHPGVARDYNNLGTAYSSLGEYHKAIRYFEKALSIDKEYYGEHRPDVAIAYNNLGSAYKSLGEYQKAISYSEKALSIDKEYFGERHPNVAREYNNLGSAYNSLGEYQKAISDIEKALTIDKEYYGERHPDVARDYKNLGAAYDSLGEYHKAIRYFEKAQSILIDYLPSNHPHLRTVAESLAFAYLFDGINSFRKEDYQTALERWRLGLDLALGVGKVELVANYCNNIGSALKYLEDYQGALDTLDLGVAILDSLIKPRQEEIKSLPDSLRQHPNYTAWERNYLFQDLRTRLRFHRAGALLRLGKRKKAKRIFQDLKAQAIKEGDKRLLEDLEKAGY